MSRYRFDAILRALEFTDKEPPALDRPILGDSRLVAAWNKNMRENFVPGWVSCLDESMSRWTNHWTCPGFIFCPRKPWPFGNEWHTICCCLCGILFALELVEGKSHPAWMGRPEYEPDENSKTVGLMIRMTKLLWGSGKVVVMDSGFCVLRGIVALAKKGVFGHALIKKRKHWPAGIPGDNIKAHFDGKPVGSVDALKGTLDGVPFHVFCMKEPDYVMQIMSTYGTLETADGKESSRRFASEDGVTQEVTFRYPEVVDMHYKYRHSVDDNNAKRQKPISLEETWQTTRWACRVWAFLLAVTEVNVFCAANFFYNAGHTCMLGFRKLFSEALIHNEYLQQEQQEGQRRSSPRRRSMTAHELLTVPKNKKFRADGTFENCKTPYLQRTCACGNRVRTYCKCSPGIHRCPECYAIHTRDDDESHQS